MRSNRPLDGEGISTSTLSVVTSQTGSSTSTQSPGRLRHSTIVPSATETPIWGMTTPIPAESSAPVRSRSPTWRSRSLTPASGSAGFVLTLSVPLVREEGTACLLHVVELGQGRLLQRRAERDRGVGGGESPGRRVQILEGGLGDERSDLRADPTGAGRPVGDQHLAGLAHAGENSVAIERTEAAEVEDLDVLVELVRRAQRQMDTGSVRDHGQLATVTRDACLAEWYRVIAHGHLVLDVPVEPLVLEEADWVRIPDRADQQALGVRRGRRGHDLQPGSLEEPGLGILGVERATREPAAGRQPHHHRDRDSLPVVELGRDVDELVEPACDEV